MSSLERKYYQGCVGKLLTFVLLPSTLNLNPQRSQIYMATRFDLFSYIALHTDPASATLLLAASFAVALRMLTSLTRKSSDLVPTRLCRPTRTSNLPFLSRSVAKHPSAPSLDENPAICYQSGAKMKGRKID
jgi:hypothetical protein